MKFAGLENFCDFRKRLQKDLNEIIYDSSIMRLKTKYWFAVEQNTSLILERIGDFHTKFRAFSESKK